MSEILGLLKDLILILLGRKRIDISQIIHFPRYLVEEYDLGKARDGTQLITVQGFRIKVVELDGACTIHTGTRKEKSLKLSSQAEIEGVFKGFYLENDEQSGKTLKLAIALDPPFKVTYYMKSQVTKDNLLGEDNTNVNSDNPSNWGLLKTLTFMNVTEDNPVDEVFYERRVVWEATQTCLKVTIEEDKGEEETVIEEQILNTSYEFAKETLKRKYTGSQVDIRLYLRSPRGYTEEETWNRQFGIYGKGYLEVRYL